MSFVPTADDIQNAKKRLGKKKKSNTLQSEDIPKEKESKKKLDPKKESKEKLIPKKESKKKLDPKNESREKLIPKRESKKKLDPKNESREKLIAKKESEKKLDSKKESREKLRKNARSPTAGQVNELFQQYYVLEKEQTSLQLGGKNSRPNSPVLAESSSAVNDSSIKKSKPLEEGGRALLACPRDKKKKANDDQATESAPQIKQLTSELRRVEKELNQWKERVAKIENDINLAKNFISGKSKMEMYRALKSLAGSNPSNNEESKKSTFWPTLSYGTQHIKNFFTDKIEERSGDAGKKTTVSEESKVVDKLLRKGCDGQIRIPLRNWCKEVTSRLPCEVKMTNFTTCWKDGLAFCALFYACCTPTLLKDYPSFDSLLSESTETKFQVASQIAQSLDVEFNPDVELIMTGGKNHGVSQEVQQAVISIFQGLKELVSNSCNVVEYI